MLREYDRIQDKERLKPKINALDETLDGSHNYKGNFPHTTRHGLMGYDLFFGGDYVFPRTINEIKDHGLEIVSFHTHDLENHFPNADMKVRVREKHTELTFPND